MKINRDLVEALLMLSLITMVLTGTAEFADATKKTLVMSGLIVLSVILAVLRILSARNR
ncbi:MAG: hypothetical protein LBD27_02145 [Tannerella sp.]|nr:hypothetical protein [Tannerella sp.]